MTTLAIQEAARDLVGAADAAIDRVVHVARPAQAGGTIRSTITQADAEYRAGRSACVWSLIQSQRQQFERFAAGFALPARQISTASLAARLLADRMLGGRIDMLHLHSGRADASSRVPQLRSMLAGRTPLVVSLHGPSAWERNVDDRWREDHLRNAASADAIIVPSEAERRFQINMGVEAERVFAVPDIVEPQDAERGALRRELGLDDDAPVVLFVGRVAREKGVDTLIEAFARVREQHPGAVLVVAGEGPLLERCSELAAPLGERVRLLGHRESVAELFADADIFASPSTGESFGRTAIEAALAGLPLVISRIEPWTDVFTDRRDCVYHAAGDVSGVADAIGRLLRYRDQARAMGDAARTTVGQVFSARASLTALDRAYHHAMEQRRAT